MLSEIQNVIATLRGLNGLRSIFWTLLLVGLMLLVFESVTQYFSISTLKSKAELLVAMNQIETTLENKKGIEELHTKLVSETKDVFLSYGNPSTYIADVLFRFIKGFCWALPLFYLFFKTVIFFARHASEDMKKAPIALFIGSLIFSATMWFATLLGVASVLWNKSDSLIISWVVFPVSSAVLLMLILGWLASLRMLMSGEKKKVDAVESDS
jgi:hypothetical protein